MATRFFCDSDSELWYTDIEELGIDTIEMPYILDGEEYPYDFGKNTDFNHFYKRLKEGARPTTCALNEYDYIDIFEPVFANGEDVFYISFGTSFSGTFKALDSAVAKLKEKYPERKFTRFDTKSISAGTGIQVYYGMKLHNSGASDEEVLNFLEDFSQKNMTLFCVDDLFHLKRGGRISGAAATVGSLFGVKPLIKVKADGTLAAYDKTKSGLLIKYFIEQMKEHARDLDKYDVWIMQAGCKDKADKLEKRIHEEFGNNVRVHNTIVGPVIGAHCGAGTIGVIFASDCR